MANQYYISNLSAKIDNMSIKDDAIFHYVRNEKNAVIDEENTACEIIDMKITNIQNNNEQKKFSTNESLDEMNQFLNDFMLKIIELKLTHTATSAIFKMFSEFVEKLHKFNSDSVLQHQSDDTIQILVGTKNIILNKLHEFDSQKKRQEMVKSLDGHLKSREICSGRQIKMKKDKETNLSLPTQVRPTFQ